MGRPGNIYVREADVYLHAHWDGLKLPIILREALKRAGSAPTPRLNQPDYLARIIFCELLKEDPTGLHSTSGYGLSHHLVIMGRYPILVVDPGEQCVYLDGVADSNIKFSDYISMSDDALVTWHRGIID